jgi:TonB family protein
MEPVLKYATACRLTEGVISFNRQLVLVSSAVLLLGLPILAHASATDDNLQQQYLGKVLTLRQFYAGEKLRFDAAGRLAGSGTPGAWTTDSQLRVEKISLRDGVVHIRGRRLFLFYDSGTQQARDLASLSTDDKKLFSKKKVDEWARKIGKTEIDVECGVEQPEMADIARIMSAVFVAPDEDVATVMPDFWKNYFESKKPRTSPATLEPTIPSLPLTQQPVYRVGGGISAPRATFAPNPPYSDLARQAGYNAVVVLWLIVDANGLPERIWIARPAGMGLDEQAVHTVQMWKFDPSKKDGRPVSVQINVEVSFRLY